MATFAEKIKNGQIIFIVWVTIAGNKHSTENPTGYKALLDTGAQVTMISEKVVKEVGLTSIGHLPIIPVSGDPIQTKKYRVRIDIPILSSVRLPDGGIGKESTFRGMDMEVGLLPYQPENHDVLLGMNFLYPFHFTMYGDNFVLSN